ncbi:hypothetical protein CJ030_MR0G005101 [Morella rubra]|uniref:Uncharacterized protein n=1 Tax=Morella rubra TaxID=262757 RepID=A0A6A1ULN4_9ROSI|nr:hypothetical protein CJ030_MR0G005101 [Morella rubra]
MAQTRLVLVQAARARREEQDQGTRRRMMDRAPPGIAASWVVSMMTELTEQIFRLAALELKVVSMDAELKKQVSEVQLALKGVATSAELVALTERVVLLEEHMSDVRKNPESDEISAALLYKKTHTNKDGMWTSEDARENFEKMEALQLQHESEGKSYTEVEILLRYGADDARASADDGGAATEERRRADANVGRAATEKDEEHQKMMEEQQRTLVEQQERRMQLMAEQMREQLVEQIRQLQSRSTPKQKFG